MALCKAKTVNFINLSIHFESVASKESSLRRIQRFMAQYDFSGDAVALLIFRLLPQKMNLKLVIDRTNWKFGKININILMLGVCYKNIAFPLLFTLLNKKGNSSCQERIDLLKRYINLFGLHTIESITGDREFVGQVWIGFLNQCGISYFMRIKKNFIIGLTDKRKNVKAFWLFNQLKPNEFYHYPKIIQINGQYGYLSGCKIIDEKGKIDFLIVVSYNKPQHSLGYYKDRWQIEMLFKGLKSSGFNIEQTHLKDLERIEKLLLLVSIAFVWAYKVGDYIHTNLKEIKIKKHQRKAISVFKYGLDYLANFLLNPLMITKFNPFQLLSCT
jgi:hypothetical protein